METRIPNWPLVLNETIDQWRAKHFAWGSADCCHFPATVIRAITGRDLLAGFPTYDSEAGAQAILEAHGGLVALLDAGLGVRNRKPVAHAYRGDVVAAELRHGWTAGICLGVYSAAMDARGLSFYQTLAAAFAWSV